MLSTFKIMVSVLMEKAVSSPLMLVSPLAPAMPVVRSQALKVIAVLTVPFQLALGLKVMLASLGKSRAALSVVEPLNCVQVPPLRR